MKIDILFLDNEMNGHDQYFDNELFQEYCETHSFVGKKNQLLAVPPSYSKSENLTFLVGLGEEKEDIILVNPPNTLPQHSHSIGSASAVSDVQKD